MVSEFRISHVYRLVAVAATAVVAMSLVQPAGAGTVKELAGRWSGWGSVKLSNGATERVRCVATYFVKRAETLINQNLRCASASYKIDAKAHYNLKGDVLTGAWVERTHSAKGNVKGRMTGDGFKLAVRGKTFSASMIVTSSPCKQSINIFPSGLDVSRIAIGLKKC